MYNLVVIHLLTYTLSSFCSLLTHILGFCDVSQVDSANEYGILLEVVQILTDLNLTISKAYISSDGGWFMDGNAPIFNGLFFYEFLYFWTRN